MNKNAIVRIGNAQGFWGDRLGAAARLVAQQPNLDFLTMDYLSEVSMSILAIQREKNPHMGYALDFVDEIRSLIPYWDRQGRCKVIANAGGLNPLGCAHAVLEVLKQADLHHLKVGVVSGDDVISIVKQGNSFNNLDTGESIEEIQKSLVSANVYLGAKPIVEALEQGADIVVTGRVADPSLTVACCVFHYGWTWDQYDRLAGATIAGHLIECGTQVTGGISTNWLDIPDPANMGYPIVEMEQNGSFVITKPDRTGGAITEQTIKEQLLYELGDPGNYLSPDVTVSFLNLKLEDAGKDRIKLTGSKGKAPPNTYKISATYRSGYSAEGMLTLFGNKVHQKAHICGEVVLQRVRDLGYELEDSHVECLGSGDIAPGIIENSPNWDLKEGVMRLCVSDSRKEAVECFAKEIAPLITSGAQGLTGYAHGRPKVRPMFGFWPCLIEVSRINPKVQVLGGERS